MSIQNKNAKCHDTRNCFAKEYRKEVCFCNILVAPGYEKDSECPFCKPNKEITNGKRYPRNPLYGKG